MTCNLRHAILGDEGDTVEARLSQTRFLVEASQNEWFQLWSQYCRDSLDHRPPAPINEWKQLGGWIIQVGQLGGRPVCVQFNWDCLDGFLVCQWGPTSELVDYKMIRQWIDEHYDRKTYEGRSARCDSPNIHNMLQELRQWKMEGEPS